MPLTPDDILQLLSARPRERLTVRELLAPLALPRAERQAALALIEQLVAAGALERSGDGRLRLTSLRGLVIGTVTLHREGYGFLTPDEPGGEDLFLPARTLTGVMPGDRVAVRPEPGRQGRGRGRLEGRVVRVVERAVHEVIGRYERGAAGGFLLPRDTRLRMPLTIPAGAEAGARPGDVVQAHIEAYPSFGAPARGRIVRVFGAEGDAETELLVVVERFGLPYRFDAAVLAAAERIPETVGSEEAAGRVDLRGVPLVTIDGETARDFDDAIAARREGEGIRLWVAIADVGYYVPEGGALDGAARERGTSVYFPDRCLPMLPERLSNGICSLNPDAERLTLAAELLFDATGQRLEERFYPALIRSRARLTYTEVAAGLAAPEGGGWDEEVAVSLRALSTLAGWLLQMRQARGSLDFDLPEAEIVLDLQGRPEQILRRERNQAHRIVEECMLAANEAVAEFLREHHVPLLYRIHEPPEMDKLQAFQQFAAHFNYGFALDPPTRLARELQELLRRAAGRPEERMLNQLLLRSMRQARYATSNLGHFGLAADCYCHFTSPIRRYPDLQVHRALRQAWAARPAARGDLAALADQTSACERRALEAERDVIELKKCQFMADKIGQTFAAVIAAVQPFGFFVELDEIFVEGLVRVTALDDDYYDFDETLQRLIGRRRRRIFQIGDRLRVQLLRADAVRREIDFVPQGGSGGGAIDDARRGAGRRSRQRR